jgi:hypothetical protein
MQILHFWALFANIGYLPLIPLALLAPCHPDKLTLRERIDGSSRSFGVALNLEHFRALLLRQNRGVPIVINGSQSSQAKSVLVDLAEFKPVWRLPKNSLMTENSTKFGHLQAWRDVPHRNRRGRDQRRSCAPQMRPIFQLRSLDTAL